MQKFNEINQTLEDSKFPEFLGSLLNWSFYHRPTPASLEAPLHNQTTSAERRRRCTRECFYGDLVAQWLEPGYHSGAFISENSTGRSETFLRSFSSPDKDCHLAVFLGLLSRAGF